MLFPTGWQALEGKDNKRFLAGEPGLGKDGARYLASKEVVAIGADTCALEVIPFEKDVGVFEVHQILLAKNGIYILVNMNRGPLVQDKACEFMFVPGASRMAGGVQAIIHPVAIRCWRLGRSWRPCAEWAKIPGNEPASFPFPASCPRWLPRRLRPRLGPFLQPHAVGAVGAFPGGTAWEWTVPPGCSSATDGHKQVFRRVMSAASNSRLSIDPTTLLPSIQSFGELSHFLRSAMADEESLQLADGMGGLAVAIEAVLSGLKREPDPQAQAAPLMDLMTTLREHRALVIALSPAWRGLYEYAAYLAALNNFRVLIGQWLLAASPQDKPDPPELPTIRFEDFELVGWRTLGEGMLLIDMYEQLSGREAGESGGAALDEARVERARGWWERLRG